MVLSGRRLARDKMLLVADLKEVIRPLKLAVLVAAEFSSKTEPSPSLSASSSWLNFIAAMKRHCLQAAH